MLESKNLQKKFIALIHLKFCKGINSRRWLDTVVVTTVNSVDLGLRKVTWMTLAELYEKLKLPDSGGSKLYVPRLNKKPAQNSR